MQNKSKLLDVIFITLLSGLIIWMLRDVFLNFNTHIVGDGGDAPIFAWNLWWVKKALIDLRTNPLHTDFVFYPTGTSLVYHTLTLTNGLISIPLQYLFNLTQTFNIIFLTNFVLSGIFTYLVCRKMNFDHIGSLFGALVFALGPNIVAQTLGHTNLYSVWFIPAILLLTIKFTKKPSFLNSAGLALAAALAVYNDYYISAYAFILAGIYLIVFLVSLQKKNYKQLLVYGLISGVIFIALVTPIFYEIKTGARNLNLPGITVGEYSHYSGDLAGFLTPSFLSRKGESAYYKNQLHNLPGAEGVNYLGLLPLILAGIAAILIFFKDIKVKRFYVIFALIGAVICLLLSLGPEVFYKGQLYSENWGFLYRTLSRVPVLKNLRVPIRFVTPAMLCLGILCAYSITFLNQAIRKMKPKFISLPLIACVGLIAVVILVSEFQTKLWIYNAEISRVYQPIASDNEDVAIMELPFRQKTGRGWETGKGFSKQQLAQTIHNKKLLSGYISFASEEVKTAPLSMPGVHYLATNLDDLSLDDQSSELSRASFVDNKIRYIVLNKKEDLAGTWYKMEPLKIENADNYIRNVLFAKIIAQDELSTVYRIDGI